MSKLEYITPGISDDMFIRGNIPMTKEEVRVITLSKLRLKEDDVVIDIGAGTGSITIEASLIAKKGKVYAVEQKQEGIYLINENLKKFGIENVEIMEGKAPDIIGDIYIDKAFIGGTGGNIKEIFEWLNNHLNIGGRVVINAITIENVYKAKKYLKENNYLNIEVIQAGISKGREVGNLTLMEAQNPIYILSGEKGVK